ncbi:MAG: thiolase family protein [Promethearchaeota archaeon]
MTKELKECVVIDAIRTPVGKSSRRQMSKLGGAYRECSSQDLLISVLRDIVDRTKKICPRFDPKEIEDCHLGVLSQFGEQGGNIARIAVLMAGLPEEIAGATVNRYCNAGLQAVNTVSNAIKVGDGDIMIAGGIEKMTSFSMGSDMAISDYPGRMFSSKWDDLMAAGKVIPQGLSSELISDKYGLTREDLDKFGMWSHQKATKAMRKEDEYFKRVVPVTYLKKHTDESNKPIIDEETGKQKEEMVTITKDQTVRPAYLDNPEKGWQMISSLKPVFRQENGKTTAGNSSQIVDGAGAVLLMSREKADELGLKPMARILSTAVAGGDPRLMLLAPIPAMERALKRADLTVDDMDVIEPNEAFASPCLAFANHFGYEFDDPRVNPTGGAIAIGHPIGASGIVYFTEMLHYMKNNNKKYGVQLMCGGFGVGIASVVESL